MSSTRKTVKVEALVNTANRMLAAEDTSADQRLGVIGFIESVLLTTGNYSGFSYLPSEWNEERLREGYDDTRRRYY